jgi:hypothetical protein
MQKTGLFGVDQDGFTDRTHTDQSLSTHDTSIFRYHYWLTIG